jgi:hypothetical protein
VTGATSLSINEGIGQVSGKTSQVVTPAQTTTYILMLNNSVSAQVTVSVSASAPQGGFTATGSMTVARWSHTATLLQNGKVLIVGGHDSSNQLVSAELYDPAAGTFMATGSMTATGQANTATLLQNGKVLIAGGTPDGNGNTVLAGAELYDPGAGRFTATGSMTVARWSHAAALLPNGKVLIAGGYGTPSAELYDPATGRFTVTGSMTVTRQFHTATLLQNGKVLIAGGDLSPSAELYDPAVGTFTATGNMTALRAGHTATLLSNGEVLLVAGGPGVGDRSAELYDPAAGRFTATGSLTVARQYHAATLLQNGKVLIAGGVNGSSTSSVVASAEQYDPSAGTFTATGSMTAARFQHTATLLPNGKALVAGGWGDSGNLASAELYQ